MARAGLSKPEVIAAGARLADDVGYANLAMAPLAERLGVKTPSLYKHVDGLADLQRGIAILAMTELGDALRDALQGRSGRDALEAFALTFCGWVADHPGRYAATIAVRHSDDPDHPDDPLLAVSLRVADSVKAVLRGYDLPEDRLNDATRLLRSLFHGFADLQAARGFQWKGDPAATLDWMVDFLDRALRTAP
ncbi:TetR/AcrR family transcriptional regulator [Actinocorallia lasiicapitis]